MVKITENKFYTENRKIERIAPPQKVFIPLIQHIGKICNTLLIKPQDNVVTGQLLAITQAQLFSPIHSSISGKVLSVDSYPHPLLGKCLAIVIENDNKSKFSPEISAKADLKIIDSITPEQIRKKIFDAGIVGLGGASFPTHIKLTPPKPITTLIINIAECEPYLTGDSQLVEDKTKEIFLGIDAISKCLNSKEVIIAIESNKHKAIEALNNNIGNRNYIIKILKPDYPQGAEKQLIKNILKKEVPQGKLPFDVGVTIQNVATVYAIYEAVFLNKPLYERVVTVTGSCIANPQNLLVPIGTPISDLIQFCSPITQTIKKIIIGGPMMGIAQYTDTVPVIKSTTGVILLNENEVKISEEQNCIRCGNCVNNCPASLMPCLINLASEKSMWAKTKEYGAQDCIECGSCNYVCPSSRKIVQSIKRAKLEVIK